MNKVILMGRVDKEPEVRYVDKGVAVANVTLCTTEPGVTLPDGTQRPEHNEWHRVILWRALAEFVELNVHEGDRLLVEGKLHHRSYTDRQDITRYVTEVWAETLEKL